jgi:SHS2 domain-containing protein
VFYPKGMSMAHKDYSLIEHTADIGIRVKAKSPKSLFKHCAAAVFALSCRRIKSSSGKPRGFSVRLQATDIQELLVNWLNELLSLSQAKGIVFSSFKISRLSDFYIEAEAFGHPITDYKVEKEIKAATYHTLKIKKKRSGWEAEVILDV